MWIYRNFVKRVFDFLAALFLLITLAPVIVVVAIFVRCRLGTPICFSQPRAGMHGKTFVLQKFRSMTDERDEAGELQPDPIRLTPTGKFLRAASLDELPQLWNVVRGEMSLVGPRPLLVEYLPRYNEHQSRRHNVRPGITGWAQINGRNAISWEEKFSLDVYYVDNVSLALDIQILLMTVLKVFQRSGINQVDQATMQKFMGTPPQPSGTVND